MIRFEQARDAMSQQLPVQDQGNSTGAGGWAVFSPSQPMFDAKSKPAYDDTSSHRRFLEPTRPEFHDIVHRNARSFPNSPDFDLRERHLRFLSKDSSLTGTEEFLPSGGLSYRYSRAESPPVQTGISALRHLQNHGTRENWPPSLQVQDEQAFDRTSDFTRNGPLYSANRVQPRRSSLQHEVQSDDRLQEARQLNSQRHLSPIGQLDQPRDFQRGFSRPNPNLSGALSKLRRAERLSQKLKELQALVESKESLRSIERRAATSASNMTSKSRSVLSQPQVSCPAD
jgi:hypothetical protein